MAHMEKEEENDMKKTQYKRWQVILGAIGFLLIMGVVGKMDQDSKHQFQRQAKGARP